MSLLQADEQTLEELEKTKWVRVGKTLLKDWRLYLLLIPMLVFLVLFKYLPIYGVLQAFKSFNSSSSILDMRWQGLINFQNMFDESKSMGVEFWRAFRNTFVNSMYGLLFGFPIPIFIALLFTEIGNGAVRSVVQVCVYLPKFLSTVVTCSIITVMFRVYTVSGAVIYNSGLLQRLFEAMKIVPMKDYGEEFGIHGAISGLSMPKYFRPIYQVSGVWEGAGYGSIVYFAAALAIDPTSYEAARIDGASKLQQIKYVTLPGMTSTLTIMLIIRIGQILNIGYEKVLLLYNTSTYETADVISTWVRRKAQTPSENPIGVAGDLMNSLIAMCLVLGANAISRRVSSTSLF